jgi:hypothetical protein
MTFPQTGAVTDADKQITTARLDCFFVVCGDHGVARTHLARVGVEAQDGGLVAVGALEDQLPVREARHVVLDHQLAREHVAALVRHVHLCGRGGSSGQGGVARARLVFRARYAR